MIKKLQQYLLLHYPIIWNIRLVPMLMVLLAIHVIFFVIGYFSGSADFFDSHYSYYSPTRDLGMLYFAAVLAGILILIGWLVLYMRNNAFRIFYPRTTAQLYLEWILIFVITIGLAFIPYTLTYGNITRWRAMATYEQAQKNLKMLETVKMLIPNNLDNYEYNNSYSKNKPIPIPNGTIVHIDDIDLDDYSFEYNKIGSVVIKGYKGASYLFYGDYDYSYYMDYNGQNYHYDSPEYIQRKQEYARSIEQVKRWLTNGQKDSIISLMNTFLRLQDKHGLKSNVGLEKWFATVYNPPFFPVGEHSKIHTGLDYSSSYGYNYNYSSDNRNAYIPPVGEYPFLRYRSLESGYQNIVNSYENMEDVNALCVVSLCVALWLSIFIFSFRVTSGRSWLIAFIGSGVIIFISTLINVAISETMSYSGAVLGMLTALFWIFLFVVLVVYLSVKVKESGNKGRSNAPMNIFLWLIPCVCPFLYFGYYSFLRFKNNYYYNSVDLEDYIETMFVINIFITVAAMWFAIAFVRKWKSIPEE